MSTAVVLRMARPGDPLRMSQRLPAPNPPQWRDVPLSRFVAEYGIDQLARDLHVTRQAVQHWLTGRNAPRPGHAMRIEEITEGRVTVRDVYVGLEGLRKRREMSPDANPSITHGARVRAGTSQ